jgi:hypothetical protein
MTRAPHLSYRHCQNRAGRVPCRSRRVLEPSLRGGMRCVRAQAVRAGGPRHGRPSGRGGSRVPRTGTDYAAETCDHVSRGAERDIVGRGGQARPRGPALAGTHPHRGCRPGIAGWTTTETCAALQVEIDNWHWSGVQAHGAESSRGPGRRVRRLAGAVDLIITSAPARARTQPRLSETTHPAW